MTEKEINELLKESKKSSLAWEKAFIKNEKKRIDAHLKQAFKKAGV